MRLRSIISAVSMGASVALLVGGGLMGCEKTVPERDLPMLDWASYVGQYPLSGAHYGAGTHPSGATQSLVPLVASEQLQAAITRTLGKAERAEFTAMSVESPIEAPEPGYLVSHICQAHNCPHGVEIIYDAKLRKLAMVFYRNDASAAKTAKTADTAQEHAGRVTCYSQDYADLSELPAAVQAATRVRIMSEVAASFTLKDLRCKG